MEKDAAFEPIGTIIGEGASFNGDFSIEGSIRIDGEFRGKVQSDNKIIIGNTGKVYTNLEGRRIIIAGYVEGNVFGTEVVHLMAPAKVVGDIHAANLIVDEGVQFDGRARIHSKVAEDLQE